MSDDRVASNYFNDVGKKKQPTAAEERALFTELSLAREARSRLCKRSESEASALRKGRVKDTARQDTIARLAGMREAVDKVTKKIASLEARAAEGYVRFVIKQARRHTRDPQTLRDLIGEGNDGLMVAVKQFNVHMGFRFLTYAVYWIDVRIQEYLNREGVVHVPNHARKASRKLRKLEETEMVRGLRTRHSFEEPSHASIDTELLASPQPEDSHEDHVVKHMVDAGLDVNERLMLINTFGLRDTEPMNLDEISDYFFALDGTVYTTDIVKTLKDAASVRLRDHLVSRGISSTSAVM